MILTDGPGGEATSDDRFWAYRMVDRKLSGQARRDALGFIRDPRRMRRDLDNLRARLEPLPDRTGAGPLARLSDQQVAEIRERFAAGERNGVLAQAYGVSTAHVSKICHGQRRAVVTTADREERDG
jgi:hypothetical protein